MRRELNLTFAGVALVLAAGLIFGQLTGCGGGGGGGGSSTTGVLQVAITDSPAFATFSSVHVRVDKVAVVPAGKENLADNDPALPVIADFTAKGGQDVNILKLHFLQQLLGSLTLPAGSYSQVRLILSANPSQAPFNNYFILANTSAQIPLTTPSAQETGLKIVGRFTVTAGTLNTVLLEFNPDQAIVRAGNSGRYNLKPTGIHIQQVATALNAATGSISGVIRSPAFATWSSASVSIVPQSPAVGPAVVAGDVFSNYSSPSVWKAPFIAYVPPNAYKVFVTVVNPASKFRVYSSPTINVLANIGSELPSNTANLTLAP